VQEENETEREKWDYTSSRLRLRFRLQSLNPNPNPRRRDLGFYVLLTLTLRDKILGFWTFYASTSDLDTAINWMLCIIRWPVNGARLPNIVKAPNIFS
jgi:hypothetical protein